MRSYACTNAHHDADGHDSTTNDATTSVATTGRPDTTTTATNDLQIRNHGLLQRASRASLSTASGSRACDFPEPSSSCRSPTITTRPTMNRRTTTVTTYTATPTIALTPMTGVGVPPIVAPHIVVHSDSGCLDASRGDRSSWLLKCRSPTSGYVVEGSGKTTRGIRSTSDQQTAFTNSRALVDCGPTPRCVASRVGIPTPFRLRRDVYDY